jgi:hypothetical protein
LKSQYTLPVKDKSQKKLKKEDRRQEVGRWELEVGKQAQTIVNSGSGSDYQICIPIG